MAQLVKNLAAMWDTWVQSLGWEDPMQKLGSYPAEGNGYLIQYSGLENSMDRGTWQATVHGVAKSRKQLSDFNCLLRKREHSCIAGCLSGMAQGAINNEHD